MAWLFSPFRGGFGGLFGRHGAFDDDRIDRSHFNETSAAADRRLEECKSLVRGQDFTGENEHRVVTFDPNSHHLVDANWSKLGKWLRALPVPLVAVRVKATPLQMKTLKISRKIAYFADASAAAKASAAQANAPQSTAAVATSSSSSSAMNVDAAAAPAVAAQPKSATKASSSSGSSASALKIQQANEKALEAARDKAMRRQLISAALASLGKTSKASARPVSKPKTKATKKDGADKVKKTPSAYILFCTEKRSEVKLNHPEATFGELGGLLGKMWTAMDATAKAPYEQMALAKKNEQQQQQPQPQAGP